MRFIYRMTAVLAAATVIAGCRGFGDEPAKPKAWQDVCTSYTAVTDTGSVSGVPFQEYDCTSEEHGATSVLVFNSSADKDKEMAAEKVMAEGLGIGMETVDEGDTWVQLRSK
jgi:hypothetical protein